ncbi:MAG: NAD(P)-binding domain-containing protein [Chloroflexota bacterium]
MKVGILGSGIVGQTVGAKFAQLGYETKIGTRDPQKLSDWTTRVGSHGSVGMPDQAAAFGDILVLATRWANGATENAIRMANPAHFAGKVVIDITNPLDMSTGKPTLSVGQTDSGGEVVQRLIPDARVVKALNIVTASTMVNPAQSGGEPDMFIAGNDAEAKQEVTDILRQFGWQGVVDLGGIESARYLESLSMIWFLYMRQTQKLTHAFKLVGK